MKQISFSSALLSTVLIAFTAIILMLLIPAYQGSQQALLEEISITHQKNQKVLQQFFDKHLQSAASHTEQLSQRPILLSALENRSFNEAKTFLAGQLSSQAGESIHAFALQPNNQKQEALQTFNTALLGMEINLKPLINTASLHRRWELHNDRSVAGNQQLLHISFPIISHDFGEVVGTLHAFILLNDNFAILSEIQSLTGAEAVGLYSESKLISGLSLSESTRKTLTAYQEKTPFKQDSNERIIHRYILSINQDQTITSKVTLPNTSLIVLQEAYTKDLGLALIAVLFVGLATVMFISRLIKNSLIKLVHYADRMALHQESEPFSPGRYEEFNRLGQTLEHMVNRISEHEDQLSGIIANTPNIIFIKDADLRYKMVSPNYKKLVGKDIRDVIGRKDEELFKSDHAKVLTNSDQLVLQNKTPQQIEYCAGKDEDKRNYLSTKFPLVDDSGTVYAIGGIVTDITDLKNAQSHSHLAGQIFDQAGEAILVLDTQFNIVSSNSAYKLLSGTERADEDLFSNSIFNDHPIIRRKLLSNKRWQGEAHLHAKDGKSLTVWLSASSIFTEEQQQRYLVIFTDISALKSAENQLERLSNYDGLTNLPNRSLFFDRLDSSIARSERAKNRTALLFINIDRFKNINDTYGHGVGDQLLIATAKRINDQIRPDDTLSRLGGDEFGVVLQGLNSLDAVNQISHQIQEALRAPFQLENFTSVASVSIGISLFPDDGTDAKTLLTHADTAMYQVKKDGRNGSQYYDQHLNQQAEAQTQLEEDLRKAFSNNELFLAYQPRFDIDGKTILSAEALARWNHPKQGYISPAIFIELAEQTGFIVELGKFILNTACVAAKSWNINSSRPMPVSVNLSARQIYDPNLIDDITEALSCSGLPPELLELEITETLAIENLDNVIDKLLQIQNMGIRMSVDDFGTGYSSLIYLKKLPVSTVKIDRSFIQDVPGNKDDEHIISAIISMSHSLELTVVAEGVENKAQLDFLKQHNCDEIQGFLLGKPGSKQVLIQHAESTL